MPISIPSHSVNNFALTLDGVQVGFLKSLDGGGMTAQITQEAPGPDNIAKKHVSNITQDDLIIEFNFSMSKPIYDWINTSWQAQFARKNGSIIFYDFAMKAVTELQFSNALITEMIIPALDTTSKNEGRFALKFAPEQLHQVPSQGIGKMPVQKAAVLQLANFRLEIDGVDCTQVMKIDSFSVKQTIAADDVGILREPGRTQGTLIFPNLTITLPVSGAQSWIDWFNSFMIQGKHLDADEKNGALIFLDPTHKIELARINSIHIGILRLAPGKVEAGAEQMRTVQFELYVERMEFVTP